MLTRAIIASFSALAKGSERRAFAIRWLGHILAEDADIVTRWQGRLVASFLAAVATFGLVPAVPTIAMAIDTGLWWLVVLDSVLLGTTYALLLSRRFSNRTRSLFLTGASFTIGALVLWRIGPHTSGLVWLFTSTFMAAFLLGQRATLVAIAANVGVIVFIAIGISQGEIAWALANEGSLRGWLLSGTNFLFLVTVFGASTAALFRTLEREDLARAEAEHQLRQARHNEALGTLAGGIAHDFNNLLVPILANIEAVRHGGLAPEVEATLLRDAYRSTERARDLVRRILAFGRGRTAESGGVDPAVVAREATQLARLSAPPGVTISEHYSPTPFASASCTALHQVLSNLIVNAVHAVGDSGQVTVSVDTTTGQGALWIRFRVSDNGMGMDARTRERIFDPYFSTKSPEHGTGLGLTIVHSVVMQLGGTITLDTAPGKGCTFTVAIPVMSAANESAPVPAERETDDGADRRRVPSPTPIAVSSVAAPPRNTRVLLVDDEPAVRQAVKRVLETLGCRVVAVEDATEALQLLQRSPDAFDVLVTDYRMPGVSGVELANAARSHDALLPVVLVSGHLEAANAESQVPTDMVTVEKPFTRATLGAALSAAVLSRQN
jgi:signal transduction histidine kinase/CheY-like chemotaxis protein